MSRFGSWDTTLNNLALFDDALAINGWFDPTLIDSGSTAQVITFAGINSGESFGTLQLNTRIFINGITSAEAFGSPVIPGPPQNLSPSAISSSESLGNAQINFKLFVSGIASSEALGTPFIPINIFPQGINSSNALGVPGISLVVQPVGISSGTALGVPAMIFIAQLQGIPSSEALGVPLLSNGATFVYPVTIDSEEGFGTLSTILFVLPNGIVTQETISSDGYVIKRSTLGEKPLIILPIPVHLSPQIQFNQIAKEPISDIIIKQIDQVVTPRVIREPERSNAIPTIVIETDKVKPTPS